jgi:hypothetical protein
MNVTIGAKKPFNFSKEFTRANGRKPSREEYKLHPEYINEFVKALDGAEIVGIDIPEEFHSWVLIAMVKLPFPSLRMSIGVYDKLIQTAPVTWSFGVLEKATSLVFESVPQAIGNIQHGYVEYIKSLCKHSDKIKACGKLRHAFEEIKAPIREKVIDELILQDAPSIIKI